MKAGLLAGFAIGLAAAGDSAAETPSATPAVESVWVGAPTPLTPAPAPARAEAPLVSPVQRSGPLRLTSPRGYPVTVFNTYHPRWVVEVFGR